MHHLLYFPVLPVVVIIMISFTFHMHWELFLLLVCRQKIFVTNNGLMMIKCVLRVLPTICCCSIQAYTGWIVNDVVFWRLLPRQHGANFKISRLASIYVIDLEISNSGLSSLEISKNQHLPEPHHWRSSLFCICIRYYSHTLWRRHSK